MKKLLVILLFCFLVISCKKRVNVPLSFDYGSIENDVYDNTFFKFKMPINKDWYVLDDDEAEKLYDIGTEEVVGDNKPLKRTIDASMVNVAKLLSIFKSEPLTTVDFNASLILNAENLRDSQEMNTTKKYLVQAKKLFNQMQMDIEYLEERDGVKIGSQDFCSIKLVNRFKGFNINQDYFVTLKDGFALCFIMSYDSDEDKELLYAMFDKLKI